jgi:hypothetical protein
MLDECRARSLVAHATQPSALSQFDLSRMNPAGTSTQHQSSVSAQMARLKFERGTSMDKKIAGLLGAVAALGTLSAVQATPASPPTDVLQANSYADLLQPIPNAAATLKIADENAPAASSEARMQVAQMHHHHHHHRPVVIRRHRHHHHHHHHDHH